MKVNILFKNNI